jgi:hypothetical protein
VKGKCDGAIELGVLSDISGTPAPNGVNFQEP